MDRRETSLDIIILLLEEDLEVEEEGEEEEEEEDNLIFHFIFIQNRKKCPLCLIVEQKKVQIFKTYSMSENKFRSFLSQRKMFNFDCCS